MAALVIWEVRGILREANPARTYWKLVLDVGQDAPLQVSASPMVGMAAKALISHSVYIVGTMLTWRMMGKDGTSKGFGVTLMAGSVELDEPWNEEQDAPPTHNGQQEIIDF